MDLGLGQRVALVTGASTGIGRATALLLAAEGAHVVGVSRRSPDDSAAGVTHFGADLTDPEAPARAVAHTIDRHGRLDVLVNNAAAGKVHEGFLDEDLDSWIATLNLNLLAAVRMMHAALPHLLERGGA